MDGGAFAEHIELVGYHDLDGRPGFKLALHESGGRYYLYVAALWDSGWSILDVTDPQRPQLVRWLAGPANTWTIQVQVADGLMVTSLEHIPGGWGGDADPPPEEGLLIWDLSDPADPQRIGHWRSGLSGTHRNFYGGGRYIHATTTQPGFDGHIYGVVDIEDPTAPRLVGRWWMPGQHVAAGETYGPVDEARGTKGAPYESAPGARLPALSLHGGPYPAGERIYAPWMRGGLVILDGSDPADPRLVSRLAVHPPLGSTIALHTAVPLLDRGIVVINSEALNERCAEPLNFAGIVDVSDEQDPILISLFPLPEVPAGYPHAGFCEKGGRFGPHNQHQPQGQPQLRPVGDFIYLTYFNAGLQVYDISDPRRPRIAGYYIPEDPPQRRGALPTELVTQVEDVLVDDRGFAYITEKNSGVRILRFAGEGSA
ncbi:MAG: hypothetical protein Q8O56_04485 [Solirubrobacteraceae bacterium]|nr:hypothetical protein [Solirubrobacteraceae bacterium]